MTLTAENVNDYLGVMKLPRQRWPTRRSEIGLVTGLAWTEVGGSILTTEVATVDGKGQADADRQTGRRDAGVGAGGHDATCARARSSSGLPRDFYRNIDIHVHVPEGAIPKDGPSAGITMATAIASALSRIPVRRDVAMTGEITLARQGAAHRRTEGKAAGGASRRHHGSHPAGRQREGPGRCAGEPAQRHEAALRQHHGRCAGLRAGASAA